MDRGSLGTSMNFAIASTADFLSTSSSRMSEGSELELLVPISSQSTRSYNQKVSSAPAVVMATVLPNVGPSSTGRLQVSSNSNKVLMVRPQGSDAETSIFSSIASTESLPQHIAASTHISSAISNVLSTGYNELDENSLPSLHGLPHLQPLPSCQPHLQPHLQTLPSSQPHPQSLPSSQPHPQPLPSSQPHVPTCTIGPGPAGELCQSTKHETISPLQGPCGLGPSSQQLLQAATGGRRTLSSVNKLKLSPVRSQRTTKLLLPKPPSSQSTSGLAYLLPGNFSISPQLQSVLASNIPLASSKPDQAYIPQQSSGTAVQSRSLSSTVPTTKPSMSVAPLHSKPRRPCNCKASKCLKLYCDCFANGEFCRSNCNCIGCHNNMLHERDRAVAIKVTIERNPLAFHPKVAKHKQGDTERRHIKGCHCKRSECLKNYCECYEAKIPCSMLCKCVECKNRPGSEMKSLLQLANVAENCSYQQKQGVRLLKDLEQNTLKPVTKLGYGRRLPLAFVNRSVVEACTLCLLQAVTNSESSNNDELQELLIIKEFGNCLDQIIAAAKAVSSPDVF